MSDAQRRAVELARFYFRRIAEQAGMTWDGDNDVEIELMVEDIIAAAAGELRGQLARADRGDPRPRPAAADLRDLPGRRRGPADLPGPGVHRLHGRVAGRRARSRSP